jgi:hypothetical protein
MTTMKRTTRTDALAWTPAEVAQLKTLATLERVQAHLDSIPYSTDKFYRAPRRVLRDRRAHCFDGAVFAAAAMERIGFPPLLVDLRAIHDDDHIVTVFRRFGCYGAVAKSNFVGLRFREPIYRSLHELVMSYFEDFFNVAGEKTLRSFSVPVNLNRYARWHWQTDDATMERIAQGLDDAHHVSILTPAMARALVRKDERSYNAGMQGTVADGLYKL